MIQINDKTCIDENSLNFKYSRSSGPGGQNVNKLNTRVELFFDVPGCQTLEDFQKQKIKSSLSKRMTKTGEIRIVSQQYRSQSANRQAAVELLIALLQNCLKTRPKRKKTHIPYNSKIKRLANKQHRSKIKNSRDKKISFD